MHDKELASGRVGHHAASHAQNAAVMLEIVLGKAVVLELALDAIAGATHAGTLGIAALNHETGDDAVKDEAVIEAAVHKAQEVVDGVRSNLRVELGLDDAAVFHLKGDYGIWHDDNRPFLSSVYPTRDSAAARTSLSSMPGVISLR